MPVKELLIEEMQDLLSAESQLTQALPKMVQAAKHAKLKEAFQKHLLQTQGQIERLRSAFEMLGERPEPKTCKGMTGLLQEGEERIRETEKKDPIDADLALIATAQKMEHYEIAGYGTARVLARQIGATDCARLLSHTLGEEESTDFLLTAIADPLIQEASRNEMRSDNDREEGGNGQRRTGRRASITQDSRTAGRSESRSKGRRRG